MSIEAMKLALEALENSVDLVVEDAYNAEQLYGNYPTRHGKVGGLKILAEAHKKASTALRQAIEQAEKQCQCPACKIKPHASDCSVHNEPAWPNGFCDCGAVEQAQKQEPDDGYCNACDGDQCTAKAGCVALSNPPPQRQPLTDEQARAIVGNVANIGDGLRIVRAIEAAHGIKGEA